MNKNNAAGESRYSPRRTADHPRRSAAAAGPADRPESQRRYRYWVEIRDLRDGSARNHPLQVITLVHLGGRKGDPPKPDERVLRLEDGTALIEARDLDELAGLLRARYPDETHERRLHWERDREAEQRYADGIDALVNILAEAAAKEILREQAGGP